MEINEKIFKITKLNELKIDNESNNQTDDNCVTVDSNEKWLIAVLLGIIFLIISAPLIFRLSNSITSKVGMHTTYKSGLPTPFGYIIHMIVFILIVRILMH